MTDAPPNEDPVDEPGLTALEESLGYSFRDRCWLRLALRHRSATSGDTTTCANNERLEFLGDAVLDLAIRAHLFAKYPDAREGALTQWRSQLAGRVHLATVAEALELHTHMRHDLPDAERQPTQRERLLADGLEALLGAVYCDADYDTAGRVARAALASSFDRLAADPREGNPKAVLQEWWQRATGRTPRYEVSAVEGPSHAPHFTMTAILGDRVGAAGSGWSKREASRNAARATLNRLTGDPAWRADVAGPSAVVSPLDSADDPLEPPS
jgi:ribonuclease-3